MLHLSAGYQTKRNPTRCWELEVFPHLSPAVTGAAWRCRRFQQLSRSLGTAEKEPRIPGTHRPAAALCSPSRQRSAHLQGKRQRSGKGAHTELLDSDTCGSAPAFGGALCEHNRIVLLSHRHMYLHPGTATGPSGRTLKAQQDAPLSARTARPGPPAPLPGRTAAIRDTHGAHHAESTTAHLQDTTK